MVKHRRGPSAIKFRGCSTLGGGSLSRIRQHQFRFHVLGFFWGFRTRRTNISKKKTKTDYCFNTDQCVCRSLLIFRTFVTKNGSKRELADKKTVYFAHGRFPTQNKKWFIFSVYWIQNCEKSDFFYGAWIYCVP